MSFEATSWALEQPIGGTKKIVLIGIASHADRSGRNAWPSIETLALYAHVDPRSVQRAIVELMQAGYLEREISAGGTVNMRDWKRPNLYHLSMARTPGPADRNPGQVIHRGDASVTPTGDASVRGGGDASVTGGVTPVSPPGGDASVTRSPFNHPIESTPLPPTGGAPGFDQVYSAYPRQSARIKAFRFWQLLQPSDDLQREMLRSIAQWRSDGAWQREGGRFIPLLWKWLRDRGWEDVPGIAPAPRSEPRPPEPQAPSAPPSAAVRAKMRELLNTAGRRPKQEQPA